MADGNYIDPSLQELINSLSLSDLRDLARSWAVNDPETARANLEALARTSVRKVVAVQSPSHARKGPHRRASFLSPASGVTLFVGDAETYDSCKQKNLFGDVRSTMEKREGPMREASSKGPIYALLYKTGDCTVEGVWRVTEFGLGLDDSVWLNDQGTSRFPVQARVERVAWGGPVAAERVRAILKTNVRRLPPWLDAKPKVLDELLALWPYPTEEEYTQSFASASDGASALAGGAGASSEEAFAAREIDRAHADADASVDAADGERTARGRTVTWGEA